MTVRVAFVLGTLAVVGCTSVVPTSPPSSAPTPTIIPTAASTADPYHAFFIENRGGPAFTVEIGGMEIRTAVCDSGLGLRPGEDNVPLLPWDLTLVRVKDGNAILDRSINDLPHWFVLIGDRTIGPVDAPVEGPPGPTCAPEVSRDSAISLAGDHTSLATLESAKAGRFGSLNTANIGPGYDIELDDLVWAVTFSGDMQICGPSPGACETRPGTATVFLDYATGAFRTTQVYSPGN